MYFNREAISPAGDICEGLLTVKRLQCCKVEMLRCTSLINLNKHNLVTFQHSNEHSNNQFHEIRYKSHTRRPGARSHNRGGDDANLSNFHLLAALARG